MKPLAFVTAEMIAEGWGLTPERRIRGSSGGISAAVWRFEHQLPFELSGPPVETTHLISVALNGNHHHTYFGDGRLKWSRLHPAFHMNMVVAGEQPRGIMKAERPFSCLHVYVPHAFVERAAVEIGATKSSRTVSLIDPMCSRDPFVEKICRQMIREMVRPDGCSRMMIDCLGQQLVVRLIRQHSNLSGTKALGARSGPGYRDWRLRRAIEFLEAHLSDDVGLDEVAQAVGLSTARLATLFREGTGDPPHRWLMSRRFARACELLGDPSFSITEIAHRCGFASSQHLSAVTRRRLAMTPTDYREQFLS
ncbi:helix-turn-helix domain-containing protein [Mycobacterium colombiense]|nr:AraC family transcriptional regulator [Mycobacterium colombiense]